MKKGINEAIVSLLEEIEPGVNFKEINDISESGIISSMDLMKLILRINEVFSISIPVEEIIPENFRSIETIEKLIERSSK